MADAENTNFEFGIQNFKPYADLQSIELGKITLIYGSNSSGKSSFVQSFLCAAQSSESSTCSLILNGELVECGTYDSVLNRKIRDQKKELVVATSRCPKEFKSSFTTVRQSLGEDTIAFSLNNPFSLRVFYKKSTTPGVLGVSKIDFRLPQIQAHKGNDPNMPDAWLVANKPLHAKKEFCYLEDIDGQWMSACIEMIRLIGEDLKRFLNERNAEKSNDIAASQGLVGYNITGKLDELNFLYCASLRIGAWLIVNEFNSLENTFSAFICPKSMPYLSGKFFNSTTLGSDIKELHVKIEKFFSCFQKCSQNFGYMRYSLGSEHNASWGSIPVLGQSVKEFALAIEGDGDYTKYRNQLLGLVREISAEIESSEKRGSHLIERVGLETQMLKSSYTMIDASIKKLEKLITDSNMNNISNTEFENSTLIYRELNELFQQSGKSVSYLSGSFRVLRDTKTYLSLDLEIDDKSFDYDELDRSVSDCKDLYDALKREFGNLENIKFFLSLSSRLNKQIVMSHEIIASMANDLHYLLGSGNKERPAIEQIKNILHDIESFFKSWKPDQLTTSYRDSLSSVWKLIPVYKAIEILPPYHRRDRIIHLGPDRPGPRRSYSIDEINSDPHLKFLREWDSEKESLFPNLNQNKYSKELACLNISGEDIVRVNTSDPLLNQCSIGILNGNTITNICDLGFGVSQVMPLVIASKTPGKDLIVVQQPETHLHPAMQADLGDLLINSAVSEIKEASIDAKKWLVETHSEVLMLRILRRLREGKSGIDPLDIKIYFVSQSDDGISRINQMKFTKSGDLLTRWPKGFFAQESMEL